MFSWTLHVYFGRQFLTWVFGTILSLSIIIFLLDLTELMRRGSGKPEATFAVILEMAAFKTPQMILTVLPFSVLVGSMLAVSRLTRNQELVVARAAGISIWQFLVPALLMAFALGLAATGLFNPVASVMTANYDRLENQVLRNQTGALTIAPGGLWLRERTPDGHAILHARNLTGDPPLLTDVMIFLFGEGDTFRRRIDTTMARLEPDHWFMEDPVIIDTDGIVTERDEYRLPTTFTSDSIRESFQPPETMSFWDLPNFIALLEEAGFPAVRHRLHFQRLLATPLLLCTMVLIGTAFSLRMPRQGGTVIWGCAGLALCFLIYFMSDLTMAFGLAMRIPELLAAWTPVAVTALVGITGLLYAEET